MRYALSVLLVSLLAPGCGLLDCDTGGPLRETLEGSTIAARPAVSDTLTVVFQTDEPYYGQYELRIDEEARTPEVADGGRTTLSLATRYVGYDPAEFSPLEADVSSDTMFVQLEPLVEFVAAASACAESDGIVQPVCSPPLPFVRFEVSRAKAPAGVRHIRYVLRDPYGFDWMTGTGEAPPLSSRPGVRRTVRS